MLKLLIGESDENELYKRMYYSLFNAVTDAINAKDKMSSDEILKNAQLETEGIYIDS